MRPVNRLHVIDSDNNLKNRSYEGVLSIKKEGYASCGRGPVLAEQVDRLASKRVKRVGEQISDLRAGGASR